MTDSNAKEYGKALFLLADEAKRADEIKSDVEAVLEVLKENPEYKKLLDTPALSKGERLAIIDEAFGRLDEYLVNLIKLLTEKRGAYMLDTALSAFILFYESSRGIERVDAISAVALTEAQTSAIKAKLEKQTGKQIIIKNTVDPSILGGIKLRYMGIQLDGSVKAKLDAFEKKLMEAVV